MKWVIGGFILSVVVLVVMFRMVFSEPEMNATNSTIELGPGNFVVEEGENKGRFSGKFVIQIGHDDVLSTVQAVSGGTSIPPAELCDQVRELNGDSDTMIKLFQLIAPVPENLSIKKGSPFKAEEVIFFDCEIDIEAARWTTVVGKDASKGDNSKVTKPGR